MKRKMGRLEGREKYKKKIRDVKNWSQKREREKKRMEKKTSEKYCMKIRKGRQNGSGNNHNNKVGRNAGGEVTRKQSVDIIPSKEE